MMKMRAIVVGAVILVAVAVGTILITREGSAVTPAPNTAQAPAEKPDESRPVVSKTGPHPKAVIKESLFKFGVMAVNESRSHKFEIENKGEAPLKLKAGTPTCKCTVGGIDKDTVAVGEKAEIELTWTPKATNPHFEQRAPIYTNDPDNTEISLKIEGDVVEVLTIEPNGVWSLGDIVDNEPRNVQGVVFSKTLDKFEITSLESKSQFLEVKSEPMSEDELKERKAKAGYKLIASLKGGVPVGPVNASVTLKTDIKDHTDFTLTLQGTRPGPIRFLAVNTPGVTWNPEAMAMSLGEFQAANGRKAKLMMFVSGMDKDFEVTKIDSDTPFLKVDVKKEGEPIAGGKQRFSLTFEVPPGSPAATKLRSMSSRVTLHTNHPEAAEIPFRVEMIAL